MKRSNLYYMADRILDGQLDDELRRMRSDGMAYEDIALELRAKGIRLSRETLRRWCADAEAVAS